MRIFDINTDIMLELLNKWAEVAEYDDNQTSFNLLSSNYTFNCIGRRIKEILSYDSSGLIGALYASYSFDTVLKDLRVRLLDFVKHPH